MKACITCGVEKPLSDYWRNKNAKSGVFGECKACARQRNTAWCQRNAQRRREPNNEMSRRRRQANPMREVLKAARHRSKLAGIPFDLTLDDVPVPTHCPVLGIPLQSGLGRGRTPTHEERDHAPSLDRINNDLGYVRGNVVVVSYRANRLKSDASVDELEAVATYYRRLEDAREREGEGGRSNSEVCGLQATMPKVFAA